MSPVLSIVMPAYNEEGCIKEVVKNWVGMLDRFFKPEEMTRLIVVNDGSRDNTGAILDELKPLYPKLVVVHQPNGGHGKAVVTGYRKAVELDSQYVFQVDSDDQFVTDDFANLWKRREESNFILGYRKVRYDAPIRLVITRILRFTIWLFLGASIKDSNIPFRLIKGSFLKALLAQLPQETPFAPNIFLSVMAKRSGQNLMNIPITHKDRATGEVSIKKMKLLKVCYKSFLELVDFRSNLRNKVKSIKALNY